MLTKKAKLERFDEVEREKDLLLRYFWDTRHGLQPEAKTTHRTKDGDIVKGFLYGTDRADGGYIVIDLKPGVPFIRYWDEFRSAVAAMGFSSEYEIAMQSIREQLQLRHNVTNTVSA